MIRSANGELVVRAAGLYLPVVAGLLLAAWRRPDRRRATGALLATVWNLVALLAVNLLAVQVGWWSFFGGGPAVSGIPADLWLGWAVLWGAVPVLAAPRWPAVVGAALVVLDLLLMPLAGPVLVLHGTWLVGEAVAVATCLIPGLALGRWTANGDHLTARVTLQATAFAVLLLLVLPALVLEATGGSWAPLLDRPRWQFVVAALLLAPPAAMALQAVAELAFHGGTPVPLDPPARLASTGPYAYVANPMQLGATVVLAGWGVLLGSLPVVLGAAVAGAFSAGFASWNEDGDLAARFGDDWRRYRASVRLWLPRLRPAPGPAAVLYVDAGCGPCSDVGAFVTRRRPAGLVVAPAATCPEPLRRIAYRTEAGRRLDGVAALAGALEHTHLGWAVACWIARLPGFVHVLQLVTDVVGGGPRVPAHLVADVDGGVDPL